MKKKVLKANTKNFSWTLVVFAFTAIIFSSYTHAREAAHSPSYFSKMMIFFAGNHHHRYLSPPNQCSDCKKDSKRFSEESVRRSRAPDWFLKIDSELEDLADDGIIFSYQVEELGDEIQFLIKEMKQMNQVCLKIRSCSKIDEKLKQKLNDLHVLLITKSDRLLEETPEGLIRKREAIASKLQQLEKEVSVDQQALIPDQRQKLNILNEKIEALYDRSMNMSTNVLTFLGVEKEKQKKASFSSSKWLNVWGSLIKKRELSLALSSLNQEAIQLRREAAKTVGFVEKISDESIHKNELRKYEVTRALDLELASATTGKALHSAEIKFQKVKYQERKERRRQFLSRLWRW